MKRLLVCVICLTLSLSGGCGRHVLTIVRRPGPVSFHRGIMSALGIPGPADEPFRMDLRGYDLSSMDLSSAADELLVADFDSVTKWPGTLPSSFKPNLEMELGKDPGLGIRTLHEKGIRGDGIGLAIIDQTLLVDHVEYTAQLRCYEEIGSPISALAEMHGAAVASIAVGKTAGVAPGASLYYICKPSTGLDFVNLAKCIDRVIEINRSLKKKEKIRALAIQIGWDPSVQGAAEMDAAVARARKAGIFVLTSSLAQYEKMAFHGMDRDPLADPNDFGSYGPGTWYAAAYEQPESTGFSPGTRLLVPMDSRCVASPTGVSDYVFYRSGGWSWCTPWLAGLYALACQVKPDVTPEEFWQAGLDTGDQTTIRASDGTSRYFGVIVNPTELIDRLSGGK